MADLPSGTVTFLFTDIESSTKLAQQHPAQWESARQRHDAILRAACEAHHGTVFEINGDAFCVAFATAPAALSTALSAQRALQAEPWGQVSIKVRMGLHTGAAEVRAGEYLAYVTLATTQRVMSVAHGGQVLLSQATCELVRNAMPADVALRDMGEHRLKDLLNPERLWQMLSPDLPQDFPPLRSLNAIPNNLPIQVTSFIGRAQAVADVKRLLAATRLLSEEPLPSAPQRGRLGVGGPNAADIAHAPGVRPGAQAVRLLTLTGSGGTGKTRLSLQAAAGLLDLFPDGVWFIELAPLTDPALVPATIATVLGVREGPGRAQMLTLSEYLRDKRMLLILDNCEHLIEACAQLADALLHVSRETCILASSREALGIAGEHVYRVPSLDVPSGMLPLDALMRVASVQLFAERAQAARDNFVLTDANAAAVMQICSRLDGIPLAIELAASRVNALSVDQIATRLDDRFRLLTGGSRTALPRQRTLRALIDWSYELLPEPERVLLRRLSVFAGGWTLEAAEAVCADAQNPGARRVELPQTSNFHLPPSDLLDLLSRLVDKSLVVADEEHGEPRYRMLATIREYARERLAADELEATHERHLNFYLGLAEQLEPHLRGKQQQASLNRLEREHDNLRGALEWGARTHRDLKLLRFGAALYLFWRQHDFFSEGLKWFEWMLALDEQPERVALRQQILAGAAYIASFSGDIEHARQWAHACVESSQTTGERKVRGEALTALAIVAWEQNDIAGARNLLEQALSLFQQVDDQLGVADAYHWLGHLALEQDDYAKARSFFLDSYTRLDAFGDRISLTLLLNDLGLVAYMQLDYPVARAYSEQNLELCREIGSKFGLANTLNRLGDLARCADDYGRADALYKESLALYIAIGDTIQGASVWHNLAHVRLSQGDGAHAVELFTQALNKFRELGDKKGVTDCLTGLAGVAIQCGQPATGARLLGACEKLRQELGATWWPANRIAYERHLSRAHELLDDNTFNTAWSEGRALTLDQAVALALDVTKPAS